MEGCTRECCFAVCFCVWLSGRVRKGGCIDIRLRQVLFGTGLGGAALSNEALSDERDESRLLMPAGMFFVVIGG